MGGELRSWHRQLPEEDMTGSFKLAEKIVQRRLGELLPDQRLS